MSFLAANFFYFPQSHFNVVLDRVAYYYEETSPLSVTNSADFSENCRFSESFLGENRQNRQPDFLPIFDLGKIGRFLPDFWSNLPIFAEFWPILAFKN